MRTLAASTLNVRRALHLQGFADLGGSRWDLCGQEALRLADGALGPGALWVAALLPRGGRDSGELEAAWGTMLLSPHRSKTGEGRRSICEVRHEMDRSRALLSGTYLDTPRNEQRGEWMDYYGTQTC